jgi:glycosyltransferase involved in cell wall biosynthesis
MLDKERFRSIIVVFDLQENHLIKKIQDAGITIIHIPVGRYYNFDAFKKAFILSKLMREYHIDIVQTYHFKSDFYGAIIAYLTGVKHIISSKRDVGDIKSKLHFLLNQKTSAIFDGYIAVADAVAEIVSLKEKVSKDKIKTIYNGVDTEIFSIPDQNMIVETRQKLGIQPSDFVVGMVAALRPEKNYTSLFEAIKKVKETIKEIKVLIVGGGDLLDIYRQYTEELGISKEVIFTNWSEDVTQYLRTFDVACLIPSRNEGFSNSVIEKMAMGLPMIVTDVGGNAEAVIDGYNGIVIPKNNVDALSDAIIYLYENPEKRKEMGARSRQRIMEHFTLTKMVKSHEEYYEKIMKG